VRSVFISYSTNDRTFVEQHILPTLKERGIKVWYSKDDILTADEWHEKILCGLRDSDWFLVVLSRNAILSEWVKDETNWACEYRKGKIVPVLREPCQKEDLHIRLLRIQYVDFQQPSPEAKAILLRRFDDDD